MAIDPRLLGGKFTTEEALRDNSVALAARQAGIDQGFAGGDLWGQGRYGQFQQGLTSYTGDFGGGKFGQFLIENPQHKIGTLQKQFNQQGPTPAPAPVTTVSQPVFTQPTIDYSQLANQISIPKVDYGQIKGLMAPTETAIGSPAMGQSPTLFQGQANLIQGQTDLTAGQADLTTGQADLTTGQTNILSGQQDITGNQQTLAQNQAGLLGSQQGIQTDVTDLQGSVGQAATGQAPATGLYAGQSGLMAGQQKVGADIGRQVSGVGSDLTDFQRAMEAYQRGAEAKRSEIQTAGVTGREQLQRQVGDVGIQANQAAEQMAMSRQGATPLGAATAAVGAVPGGVQQQAAQIAQAAPAASQTAPMGPLGPVTVDPRDALIQQLFTAYQGLMTPQQ